MLDVKDNYVVDSILSFNFDKEQVFFNNIFLSVNFDLLFSLGTVGDIHSISNSSRTPSLGLKLSAFLFVIISHNQTETVIFWFCILYV